MTSTDAPAVWSLTARAAYLDYRVQNPWPVLLSAEWPRAALQCLFFTVVAGLAAPDARAVAFPGALAMVLMLATVVEVSDVPALDKWSGTLPRLLLSGRDLFTLYLVRALPQMLSGLAALVVAAVVTAAVLRLGPELVDVAHAAPVYLLMAVTTTIAGLTVAATALGRRADVVVSNGFLYLVTACCGLLVPVDDVPVLSTLGLVLPTRHGIDAVRAIGAGEPWLLPVVLECLVGLGWLVVGVLLYRSQARRAIRSGNAEHA